MTWRMTVPDRPDLFVDVDTRGSPSLPHRMQWVDGDDLDHGLLRCDCGWETYPVGRFPLYLDDLAAIAAEHYRTADQPGLLPAQTTT